MSASGSPPWAHSAGITDYGGHTSKANYMSVGKINPKTDIDAADINAVARDLAAITNTSSFAKLTLTQDDSTPDDPTVHSCRLMTGVASAEYAGDAPPTGFPTVTRVSDGVIDITFSSSYTDAYGVSQALGLEMAWADVAESTVAQCTCIVTNSYTVRVYTWDNVGAAETDQTITVEVA